MSDGCEPVKRQDKSALWAIHLRLCVLRVICILHFKFSSCGDIGPVSLKMRCSGQRTECKKYCDAP